jgi:hypothetical protein
MVEFDGGGVFSYTFPDAGVWHYICQQHSGPATPTDSVSETNGYHHRDRWTLPLRGGNGHRRMIEISRARRPGPAPSTRCRRWSASRGSRPRIAILGDLDADGTAELIVAVPTADLAGHEAGAVAWVPSRRRSPRSAPRGRGRRGADRRGAAGSRGRRARRAGISTATATRTSRSARPTPRPPTIAEEGSSRTEAPPFAEIDRFDGGAEWGRIGERLFAAGDPDENGTDDLRGRALPDSGRRRPERDGSGSGTGRARRGWRVAFDPDEPRASRPVDGSRHRDARREAQPVPDVGRRRRDDLVLGAPASDTTSGAKPRAAPRTSSRSVRGGARAASPVFDETSALATIVGRDSAMRVSVVDRGARDRRGVHRSGGGRRARRGLRLRLARRRHDSDRRLRNPRNDAGRSVRTRRGRS